jgi:hypothetical protein
MDYYVAAALLGVAVAAYLVGFHAGGFVAWVVFSRLPQPGTKNETEVNHS